MTERDRDTQSERGRERENENVCTGYSLTAQLSLLSLSCFPLALGLPFLICETEWIGVHDLFGRSEGPTAKECNDLGCPHQYHARLDGFCGECLADHSSSITLKYLLG